MTEVVNPGAFPWARLSRSRVWVLANADSALSVAECAEYAAARGVPPENVLAVPLGTNPNNWTPPGGNGGIDAVLIAALLAHEAARGHVPHGIVCGPGCPPVVRVEGVVSAGVWNAAGIGWPPLQAFVAGYRSFRSRTAGAALVAIDGTSGLWVAARRWLSGATSAIWPGLLSDYLGTGDPSSIAPSGDLGGAAAPYSARVPSTAATAQLGRYSAAVVPVGRLGWWSWLGTPAAETAGLIDGIMAAADAGAALTAQPAPVVVSIADVQGADSVIWSRLANRLQAWGFVRSYHYRKAPSAENEADAPLAGAVAGTPVDLPAAMYLGAASTGDQYAPPWSGAILAAAGGGAAPVGPSDGFKYALRLVERGAAWGVADVSHKTAPVHDGAAWVVGWLLLAGMSVIEAVYYSGALGILSAIGDPLAAPFHYRAGPAVPNEAEGVRVNRRGAPGRGGRRRTLVE